MIVMLTASDNPAVSRKNVTYTGVGILFADSDFTNVTYRGQQCDAQHTMMPQHGGISKYFAPFACVTPSPRYDFRRLVRFLFAGASGGPPEAGASEADSSVFKRALGRKCGPVILIIVALPNNKRSRRIDGRYRWFLGGSKNRKSCKTQTDPDQARTGRKS